MVVESLAHSPFPADLSQQCRMSDIGCRMSDVGCRMSDVGCRMSDVGCRMSDVGCRMSDVGCRMSDFNKDFYKSDVGFWILTSRLSDFRRSDGLFLQVGCRMSDFNKSDVGWHL